MKRLARKLGSFFYILFGYKRVADRHFQKGYSLGLGVSAGYEDGYTEGWAAGDKNGFALAVETARDWYEPEPPERE